MNDVAEPSADDPALADVNVGALQRPDPPADVDAGALRPPAPSPEVNVEALTGPAPVPAGPTRRGRRVLGGLLAAAVVAAAGGGGWWHRQVTGDPHLGFSGPNVSRDQAATDLSGIVMDHRDFDEADRVKVTFVPGGRLSVFVGLYNGGRHDVRIEAAPAAGMYYWAFDGMSVSSDPQASFATRYRPFQPFTLHRGETRDVRLDFHQADCDPAAFQPGGFSTVRGLRLRYRTLGISRSAAVPFQDAAVALQASGTCIHPIVTAGSAATS